MKMNWFSGEITSGIQKAISEKKLFIVFVKDENEDSKKMGEIWNDNEVVGVCNEDSCVAINIDAGSVPGQQFGAIYPILCVPSTYLIDNQGSANDIIPGLVENSVFLSRLENGIKKHMLNSSIPAEVITESNVQIEKGTSGNTEESLGDVQTPNMDSMPESSKENVEVESCSTTTEVTNGDLDGELTTQEKSEIEMLREKVKLKKEQEEKQRLKDMEKKRRETGHELQLAQRQMAEQQAVQLAKEIADRKAEEKAAREKVREQIRQDRLEKTRRFDAEKKEREEGLRNRAEAASAPAEKKKEESNTARLQFRLPDGSSISNQFNADAKFLVAEAFVKDHTQIPSIRLTTVYPKHEFNSEDALKSFRELGLVPNASIIVSRGRSNTSSNAISSTTFDPISIIMTVLAPIFAIFNWIASLFSGNTATESNQSTTASNPRDDTVRRRNLPSDNSRSNIQRLRRDEDDDNATWNGNSTQQM